jgi:hypothetical protein
MIMKLFEKLNNPVAVVLILIAILVVNGFIFYQQSTTPREANAPSRNETPSEPSQPDTDDTDEEDAKGEAERASGSRDEENDRAAPPENENSSEETSGDESPADSEEEPSGDEPPEEDRNASPEDESSEDESSGDESPSGENGSGGSNESEGESRGGSGGESQNEQSERDDESSERDGEAPLAGLGDALDGCEGSREGCVRDFVSRVSPDSRYIGGRTDLASGDSGQNSEVLYFEDPGMEACQYERGRHEGENLEYTVILVGPGSFDDERGDECIPTA